MLSCSSAKTEYDQNSFGSSGRWVERPQPICLVERMYCGHTSTAMEDEGRMASGIDVKEDSELVPVDSNIVESSRGGLGCGNDDDLPYVWLHSQGIRFHTILVAVSLILTVQCCQVAKCFSSLNLIFRGHRVPLSLMLDCSCRSM